MTRREKLQARADRRAEWAAKASARADRRFGAAHAIADGIPMGQPILVGHHSERHARRDAARIHGNMSAGVAESKLADRHAACAAEIEHALDRSVFSDDPDAIEALEARIAATEAKAERYAAINRAWRKAKGAADPVAAMVAAGATEALARTAVETMSQCSWLRAPLDATNLRASIRRDRERITEVRARQERAAAADAAGGVVVTVTGPMARVTFAERPDSVTLNALRSAGFAWRSGSWIGSAGRLPPGIMNSADHEASTPAREYLCDHANEVPRGRCGCPDACPCRGRMRSVITLADLEGAAALADAAAVPQFEPERVIHDRVGMLIDLGLGSKGGPHRP